MYDASAHGCSRRTLDSRTTTLVGMNKQLVDHRLHCDKELELDAAHSQKSWTA